MGYEKTDPVAFFAHDCTFYIVSYCINYHTVYIYIYDLCNTLYILSPQQVSHIK